jgi:PAS domain S-box-containing protein
MVGRFMTNSSSHEPVKFNRTRLLEALLDSATDYAIIAMDLDGLVTSWNEGARRILGWTEEEMIGQPASVFFTLEDRQKGTQLAEMQNALDQGRGNDERWHQKKDGTCFWASGEMMPLRDENGTPQGFLKILRDRTDQRQAAEAQRADAEFLHSVLASSGDCIKVLDLDAKLEFMNEGGLRIMEVSDFKAIRGRPWPGFWPAEEQEEAWAAIETARAGASARFQGFADTMKGTRKCWDVQVTAIPGALGRPEKLLAVSRDITEQKRIEGELRELNDTLERRIEERTRELRASEDQLRQSQKLDAIGQLTGGVAHDFNNLLTGISGSLEILQTRLARGQFTDVDRFISAAQGASKRAAALTHRLLAFSRRQTLDPKPTNANRLIEGMEDLVRRTVGPSIEVETVLAEDLWITLCDVSQLENSILNLCINARDAMPDGGKLTIQTANTSLDGRAAREKDMVAGQYVMVCVTDTGIGMAPEVIERAFDPFYTTKPMGQGTGLGLSMTYGFAKQSGGQVRIYSEVGRGTTMRIFLPRHAGEEDAESLPAQLTEAPRAQAGETVLIVDDDEAVRMLVAEVLQELGYGAIEAADGTSGLNVLQSNARIDLLITDVGLPGGINGRQIADAARVRRPGLKVLFITGYAENAVVRNGYLEAGMQIMIKPFTMEALATRIQDVIACERATKTSV